MYLPSTIDFLSDRINADSEDNRRERERDPAVISRMVGLSDGSQTTIFAVSDTQTLNIQLRGCACWQSISLCWIPRIVQFLSHTILDILALRLQPWRRICLALSVSWSQSLWSWLSYRLQRSTFVGPDKQRDLGTDWQRTDRQTDRQIDRSLAGWMDRIDQ